MKSILSGIPNEIWAKEMQLPIFSGNQMKHIGGCFMEKIVHCLRTDEELLEMRKEWKELDIEKSSSYSF